jgi:hypothetical protein
VSIALPTLLLVAALVPSIAFVNSFYAGKFPRQLSGLSPLGELALYFFWALLIDSIALHVAGVTVNRPVFDVAARLFGLSDKPLSLDASFGFVQQGGWWPWVWGYALLVFLAAAAGSVSRRFVWALRLDVLIPILRLRAEWFYVLLGRTSVTPKRVLPQADVLVSHPQGSRLYAGIVLGLEPSKDGTIEELYLIAAQRYRKNASGTDEIVDIPGDVLMIPGETIHSINMRYLVRPPPSGIWSRIMWWTGNFVRALLKEA